MLTQAIENLLNRGLPDSPRGRELAAQLAGRRLAIDIRGVARVLVESRGDSLSLTHERGAAAPAEAEVRGGPIALMALAAADDVQAAIRRGEISIEGDTDLAERYRELALLLRPDIEEEMSRLVGDGAAHRLGQLAKIALSWGRQVTDTSVRNTADYLAHERGDLVPRAEADEFLRGVDALREALDRLDARVGLLERRE
jgi:ubiquinone biosynthesis accessory factor UbiJ